MRTKYLFISIIFFLLIISCRKSESLNKNQIRQKVLSILNDQQVAWNSGDIKAYMQGYLNADSLRFASGGTVTFGWQKTLERYQEAYPDKSSMGMLIFSKIDVKVLSETAALVFGKWQLSREKDHPWGLFTLLFRNKNNQWRIVHDHTSIGK